MKDERLYLEHIRDAIAKIEQYTTDGRETFFATPMMQDAVIRNFEIIGEATKRIGDEIRRDNSGVPWRSMAAFRDVLIHDYAGIDLVEVWNVISHDMPSVKSAIDQLLSDLE